MEWVQVASRWSRTYPGAAAGFLAMQDVAGPERSPALDLRKTAVEDDLRARFAGAERAALAALPSVQPYVRYFARFKKTYHVLLQLESVALKGKPLPRVAALVEAMFLAEVKNQLLTAGHDLDAIHGAVRLDVATGEEQYVTLRGQPQPLKAGDMLMADDEGVISSMIYGPDYRTRLTRDTRRALFAIYAPAGIPAAAVTAHLEDVRTYVRLVAEQAAAEFLHVYEAGAPSPVPPG